MQNSKLDTIKVPANKNPLIQQTLEKLNDNLEVKTLWKVINVNAIDRLGMTDHGIVHFQIVANIGLKIARTLEKNNIPLSIVNDFGLTQNHGELVVMLGCLFHDTGMSISRPNHEEFSLFLTNTLLRELLEFLPVDERTIVISETLHTIISHRKNGQPITIEAGIVRVADALDMTEGRSRVSHEAGSMSIHSLSHAAINSVDILDGDTTPIKIHVNMFNTAGMFQIGELMQEKLKGSNIEKYVEVVASVDDAVEKKLMTEFKISF